MRDGSIEGIGCILDAIAAHGLSAPDAVTVRRIRKVVRARARSVGSTLSELAALVERDPLEAWNLVDALRPPSPVDPRAPFFDPPPPGVLRIWVPACGTGEAAWAMALRLGDELGVEVPWEVLATDARPEHLALAARAELPTSALTRVPPALARWLRPSALRGRRRVRVELRGRVVFARHGLGEEPPPPRIDLTLLTDRLADHPAFADAKTLARFTAEVGVARLGPKLESRLRWSPPAPRRSRGGVEPGYPSREGREPGMTSERPRTPRDEGGLTELAVLIAHDLRAPIRHARVFARGIRRVLSEESPVDDPQEILHQLESALERATLILSSLRVHRGLSGEVATSRVAIARVVEAATELLRLDLESAGARVEVDVGDVAVRGYPSLLERLFQNLIANALEHRASGHRPLVRIRAEVRGDETRITVEDDGRGIPPEAREQVFEPGGQLDPDTTPGGLGVGLGSCRWVAQRHGGRLELDASPLGGARFTLVLKKQ